MELKVIFGLCAVACELFAAFIYWKDILRGNTKPHLYTHLIFAIVMTIAFFGITAGGGASGAWSILVTIVFEVSVTFAALKWGTRDITKGDTIFLVLALAAIVPWIVTDNPLWSVILISIIDMCAIIPTLRKTYNEPSSESLQAWILAFARGIFQLSALGVYSVTTVLYPLEVLSADTILISIILARGGLLMLKK